MPKSNRPALTRAHVLTAAVSLADREGLSALTMRALGAELGVEAMSLYHHVKGKRELLDAVVDAVVAEVPMPYRREPWNARLRAFGVSYRALAHQHPHLFPLVAQGYGRRVESLVEAVTSALEAAGLPRRGVAAGFAALASYVEGFCSAELSGSFAGTPVGSGSFDDAFLDGLEVILDGLALRADTVRLEAASGDR